ncbi:hypothetical protein GGF31_008569 [Allomyces arbusculus]|nr:hypothetical protein GGF31_008569 [Allomyces arbusculus]
MAPPAPMSAGPVVPTDPAPDPPLSPAQASQLSIDASRIDVSATRKQFQQLTAAAAAQSASDAASVQRRSASPNRSVGGAHGSLSAMQLPDDMSTTVSLTSSVSTMALGNVSATSLPGANGAGATSRTMLQDVNEAMRRPPMSPTTRAGAPPSRSASTYGLAATPSRSTSLHALAASAAPPMTPSRWPSTSPHPRKQSASAATLVRSPLSGAPVSTPDPTSPSSAFPRPPGPESAKFLPPPPLVPPVPHLAVAHLGAYTSLPDLTHHPSPPSSNTSSACTTDSWPSTASLGSKSPIAVRRRRRSSVGTSVLTTTTSSVAAPAGGAGLAAASAPALPTSTAAAAAADATEHPSSIRRSMSDHLPATSGAAPATTQAAGASEHGLHAVAGTADQDGPYILSRHAPDGVTILEQYIVGNCIGRGQFGAVFRAINVDSHQTVAIKRFELANNKDQETILTEVRKMETLDHPNVVKYIGFIQTETDFNIILEFVENGSLASTLKHFGPLPEKVVVAIVFKVLQGLTYIHQQGLKHLDLKAANILTTKDGNVKLSDFGVSQSVTDTKSDGVGTAYWMAPEIIYPGKSSTASDIWSLGCTIIELLTGEPPYYEFKNPWAALYRIVEDACPPLPDNISDDMRSFLLCCLQKDENARWTAAQLLQHPWIVHSVYNQGRRGTGTPGTPGFPKAPAPPPPPSPPVATPTAPEFSMLLHTTTVARPSAPYNWLPRPIASPVSGGPPAAPARQAMTDDSVSVHATELSSVGTLPPTTFLPDSTPMATTTRHGPATSSPPALPLTTVFPSPLQMAQLARSPHVPPAPTPVVGALVDRMRDVVSPGRAAARRRSGAAAVAAAAAAAAAAGFVVPADAPPVPGAARNPHKWIKLALDACVECRICAQLVRKGRVCATCSAIVCKACAACPPIGGHVVVCGGKPGATPPATTSPASATPPSVAALRPDDYAPMPRRDKAVTRRVPPPPLAAMDAAFWSAIEPPPSSTTTVRTPATPSLFSAPPGPLAVAALAGGGVPHRKPAAARDDCVVM